MLHNKKLIFGSALIVFSSFTMTAFSAENEPASYGEYEQQQATDVTPENLHTQLNSIYKNNQQLKNKLQKKEQSLNHILTTLSLLNKKLDFKINANSSDTVSNNKTVTLADFNSRDDELIRKCDEIVDNYYSRKGLQEKNYVQSLYDNEQSDPEWERGLEDKLQNFISSNNLNQSEFLDINCKSSVCQMRVQHVSSAASRQFKNKLHKDSDWDIYATQNKFDRATGGILTNITFLRDRKKIQQFIWEQ